MKFFRILIFAFIFGVSGVVADTEENAKNLVEKAKEINKKVKLKAASELSNISDEEPLPLNDPFVGDASISGGKSNVVLVGSEEEKDERSLYNFKLVGIISGTYESYISLVNASGDVMTLQLHEELSEGVRLVDMKFNEAIFQKEDDTYITINFNNQIKETDEY